MVPCFECHNLVLIHHFLENFDLFFPHLSDRDVPFAHTNHLDLILHTLSHSLQTHISIAFDKYPGLPSPGSRHLDWGFAIMQTHSSILDEVHFTHLFKSPSWPSSGIVFQTYRWRPCSSPTWFFKQMADKFW